MIKGKIVGAQSYRKKDGHCCYDITINIRGKIPEKYRTISATILLEVDEAATLYAEAVHSDHVLKE